MERLLPHYQFSEQHRLLTQASPAGLMDAVLQPGVSEDPWARRFIQLRELPDRLRGALGGTSRLQAKPPFGIDNFTLLGREGDAEIALGLAGRFWQADYGQRPLADAQAFAAFGEPGSAKLLLQFSTRPDADGGTWLHTETRVFCTDRDAVRRFTPYWYLIRPVSGLIRRRLLARVRDAALAAA
ncbi:hypothetical protein [Rhodoferax sp.]|uniref:hypothetical protein n=1 Tax=Rhodoferax sp. TaxID=50421 RepID=UPI0025DE5463|nr:hypothetical protein [Rhodoferax sp.]